MLFKDNILSRGCNAAPALLPVTSFCCNEHCCEHNVCMCVYIYIYIYIRAVNRLKNLIVINRMIAMS